MQGVILTLGTALAFLGREALMLRFGLRPLVEARLGDWLLDSPRPGAGGLFYLVYVAGMAWLAGPPAYGTYQLGNCATLGLWAPRVVAADLAWAVCSPGCRSGWGGGWRHAPETGHEKPRRFAPTGPNLAVDQAQRSLRPLAL